MRRMPFTSELKDELEGEREKSLKVEGKLRELEREHQQLGITIDRVKEERGGG